MIEQLPCIEISCSTLLTIDRRIRSVFFGCIPRFAGVFLPFLYFNTLSATLFDLCSLFAMLLIDIPSSESAKITAITLSDRTVPFGMINSSIDTQSRRISLVVT